MLLAICESKFQKNKIWTGMPIFPVVGLESSASIYLFKEEFESFLYSRLSKNQTNDHAFCAN